MSDRERRPSTIKASESLLEKQKIRENIKKSTKVSNNLKKLIEQEEAELDKSAVELLTLSTELYGEEPDPQGIYTETPSLNIDKPTASPAVDVSEEENLDSSIEQEDSDDSCHYVDPLHAVKSPVKAEDCEEIESVDSVFENPHSPAFGNIDSPDSLYLARPSTSRDTPSWSSTNQFFPPGCESTPQRRQVGPGSGVGGFQPSTPTLLPIINEEIVENIENIQTIVEQEGTMDPTLVTRLADAANAAAKIERRISNFGPEDITLEDKDSYKEYLKVNRELFEEYEDIVYKLKGDLDVNEQEQKTAVETLENRESQLRQKFKKNNVEIKMKVSQLVSSYESSRPMNAAEVNNMDILKQQETRLVEDRQKASRMKQEKCKLKMQNSIKKCKSLIQIVKTVKEAEEMTENEVRHHMVESKEWKKTIEGLTKAKEDIDVEILEVEVEASLKSEYDLSYEDAFDRVENKIKNLHLQDKERGLYSLAPSKVKETVVYPTPFEGKVGENVYKFVENIRDAIEADQVRTTDQVKTLRKYLRGKAKVTVGEHMKDLDEALKTLTQTYGNRRLIWKKLIDDFAKEYEHPKIWGKIWSSDRLNAISGVLDFMDHAETLAEDNPELSAQIYHDHTLEVIFNTLPHDYRKEYVTTNNIGSTSIKKFALMKGVMEVAKQGTLSGLEVNINTKKPDNSGTQAHSSKLGRSQAKASNGTVGGTGQHWCRTSKQCEPDWGIFGCIEVYKLTKAADRRDYILSKKACPDCGNFPPSRMKPKKAHSCYWSVEKFAIKCTGISGNKSCPKPAALCLDHKAPDNATPELRAWLAKQNMRFTVTMVSANNIITETPDPNDYIEDFIKFAQPLTGSLQDRLDQFQKISSVRPCNKEDPELRKQRSKYRDLLQEGKLAKNLEDHEIQEFFTEDMRVKKVDTTVHPLPGGTPVFIFCIFEGKTQPICTFIDSGANCWLAKDGIPQNQLDSIMLQKGPIPLGVAGDFTVQAESEWASLIPLADNTHQIVRGLVMKSVTGPMPELNLVPVLNNIKSKCKEISVIQNIEIPEMVGGNVDMLLGIRYQRIFPEVLHTLPNGLTVFKSKLKPIAPNLLACIGGPVDVLETLCNVAGTKPILNYMSCLVRNWKNYKLRCDFFPETPSKVKLIDADLPGAEELIKDLENSEDSEEEESLEDFDEGVVDKSGIANNPANVIQCSTCCTNQHVANAVQSELDKFMKMQDAGLSTSYKCPQCRRCKDCLRGPGKEMLSMHEEAEQHLIRESVRIDPDKHRAVAYLAFTADPATHLSQNLHIAVKRMKNVCRKYGQNKDVTNMIQKGFEKLLDRGHIIRWEDLAEKQRKNIEESCDSYVIPWDVGFKESSLSTPARPTFDASSKTPAGFSLNDILAKGSADLVSLVTMLLDWLVGPSAIAGDISQFYNTVLLEEEHWKYQQVVWFDNMDPTGTLRRGVIRTCIYGVKCVGSQTEEIKRLLAAMVRNDYPGAAQLLEKFCYVDDLGRSTPSKTHSRDLMKLAEEVLDLLGMKIKGWGVSGEHPPPEVSDDGVTVGFAGLTWATEVDCFKLNLDKLHFGKKKRGRYPDDMKRFDGSFGITMEQFVPQTLSRRNCSSVSARIYDLAGKLAPLTLRLKYDLRQLIKSNPDWDDPISPQLRQRWIQNFKMIDEMRDILYVRCPIPSDALRPTVRILILCDGAKGGMIITAYSGNERPDSTWSCNHLFSKSLLAPEDWSTPQLELHALHTLANILAVLQSALHDWIEFSVAFGDSTIALSWAVYEKTKLHVFHRLRVSNIRNKIDLEDLYHVDGRENIADVGTRPDLLTTDMIMPDSEWIKGKSWMNLPITEAVNLGVIKSVKDIKLSNDAKKVFKEGIVFDSMEDILDTNTKNSVNHGFHPPAMAQPVKDDYLAIAVDASKVVEREVYANYIYPPLRRSFRPTVRIIGLVLAAVNKFKKLLIIAKIRRGMAEKTDLQNLNPSAPKFTIFSLSDDNMSTKNMAQPPKNKLVEYFRVNGVVAMGVGKKQEKIALTDSELSASLEYLYKKETMILNKFNDKKLLVKAAVLKEDVYYCKTRLLEGQDLKVVGDLEEKMDLFTLTGINFNVPVLDKMSPLAISVALHLHYEVVRHKGYETTFRLSLQFARILQGRILFKHISEECVLCKKLRLDYLKQIMGPLSEYQLSISPVFYYTYIDAWGPLKSYVPGFERETRSGVKVHTLQMVIFACAATGMINCQIMEGGKKTEHVLDVFNRFFHEACVPKICFPDKDGALMKSLAEGQVELLNRNGYLARERGITFHTCPAQGHSAHGRVERRIKMIQECLERSQMKGMKLHTMGWQTVAKCLEHEVNSVPLGFLHHQTDAGPLLRVLTPNLLKLNTASNRAPVGLFTIPDHPTKLMDNIEECYKLFYKVWNTDYVPLIAGRQKWHQETENLRENDVVYFKLRDSVLSTKWVLGKVEFVMTSKDNKVRKVGISYKQVNEEGEGEINVVERPARDCVKLFHIDDTTLLDDLKAVREAATKILDEQKVVSEEELNKLIEGDEVSKSIEKVPSKNRKKKKSEVENLKIDGWEEPKERRRSTQFNAGHSQALPHFTMVSFGIIPQSSQDPLVDDEPQHDGDHSQDSDHEEGEQRADPGHESVVDWEMTFGTDEDNDLDINVPFYLL